MAISKQCPTTNTTCIACVVYLLASLPFLHPDLSLVLPPSLSVPLSLCFLPSLLAYLYRADVHEPLDGIIVAFLKNQREQTGVLGIRCPPLTASRSIQVTHSNTALSFSSTITAVSTTLVVTNPKEHIMTHQSLLVCIFSSGHCQNIHER